MTKIKYVFLVFKNNNEQTNNSNHSNNDNNDNNGNKSYNLEPFIFNIKELIPTHQPILKKIEKLIKNELSYRFGILDDDEYKGIKLPFDNEYKLWYSRYVYGEFFHIITEYLHTMINISDKAHNYKNSIILNKLTYACGLNSDSGKPFFKDIKLDYQIRNFKIGNKNSIKDYISDTLPTQNSDCNQYKVGAENEFRPNLVFCLYNKAKAKEKAINRKLTLEKNVKKEETKINIELLKTIFSSKNKIRFILMFKTFRHNYSFIYEYLNVFYKLVIESNISNILDSIINELNKKVLSNRFNDMTINFEDKNNTFRIVSNDVLNTKDYTHSFIFCPYILKHMVYNKEQKVDISYYYKNELLDIIKILNYQYIYLENLFIIVKPYLYDSFTQSKQYNDLYIKYDSKNNKTFNNINSECEISINYDENYRITNCDMKICNPNDVHINCIFLNLDECGYDIIELISNENLKLLIYIIPSKIINNNIPVKYLGNFLHLDKTSIPMLKAIKKKYVNNNYVCFIHHTIILRFYILHFHICPKSEYERIYPKYENGQFMLQDMFIDDIINNIKTNKDYYFTLDYNIIRVQ